MDRTIKSIKRDTDLFGIISLESGHDKIYPRMDANCEITDKYLIDKAIEYLYEGCRISISDRGGLKKRKIFDKLLRELFAHHKDKMKDHVKYDKDKLTIEFI